jgi:hypothetical protein
MTLGQAEELPRSSSVFEDPSWRADISFTLASGKIIGEAAARIARREIAKNLILKAGFVKKWTSLQFNWDRVKDFERL